MCVSVDVICHSSGCAVGQVQLSSLTALEDAEGGTALPRRCCGVSSIKHWLLDVDLFALDGKVWK